jgi:hypothetical protein
LTTAVPKFGINSIRIDIMIITSKKFARAALICGIALSAFAQAESTVSTHGLPGLSIHGFQETEWVP